VIRRLPRPRSRTCDFWGKSWFRVKDSLKAGTADFAAAVNHIAGRVDGTQGRGARAERTMFEALFGTEMPLALRFFVALIIVVVVVGVAVISLVTLRISIRRLIIRISELLALLVILLSTIGAGLATASWADLQARLYNHSEGLYTVLGFVFGGLSGFVTSAILLGIWFILIEIAENTRRMVAFFEHLSSSKQA
jgi:hypothetical protein